MFERISKYQTSLGQCEWKVHEPGFDEEYSIFVEKAGYTAVVTKFKPYSCRYNINN
jgi:hypothetical protein